MRLAIVGSALGWERMRLVAQHGSIGGADDFEIVRLQPTDIEPLARLAREIWNEYYPPIVGQAQVDYMLDKLQSAEAIRSQIDGGVEYGLIRSLGVTVGYTAIKIEREQNRLWLSKLYLRRERRGEGFATRALICFDAYARENGLDTIWLIVNRGNSASIAWYRRRGFEVARAIVTETENGFVLDDYLMERAVPSTGEPPVRQAAEAPPEQPSGAPA